MAGIDDQKRYARRMTWEGEVVWSRRMPVHHDIACLPDGRLLTIMSRLVQMPEIDAEHDVRDDAIAILSATGEVIKSVSVDAMRQRNPQAMLLFKVKRNRPAGRWQTDLYHLNSGRTG